jgi:hypothetical protein
LLDGTNKDGRMTQSEKFDACMKQADYFAARFDGRREFEWKITLGFWAAILASIQFLKGNAQLQSWQSWQILLVGVTLALCFSFFWLKGIWAANESDKRQSFHFRDEAEKVLLDLSHTIAPTPGRIKDGERHWFGFLSDWSIRFQAGATLILVILACLSL